MRINRIKFSKIKLEWEMLKSKSALLLAQKEYDDQIRSEVDRELYSIQMDEGMTPESMHLDDLMKYAKPISQENWKIREYEDALLKMEEQGRKLLKEEKYELMRELKELYEQTKKELEAIRSNISKGKGGYTGF